MEHLDDSIIAEANTHRQVKKSKKHIWIRSIAAAACICLVIAAVFSIGSPTSVYAISEAKYPEVAQYPNEEDLYTKEGEFDESAYARIYDPWWQDASDRRSLYEEFSDCVNTFFDASFATMLSESGGENRIYSPLNVYMALAMLAEVTDGSSRQQILDLLGVSDIEALREEANAVWKMNYRNDGAYTSILASSLWLSNDLNYKQSTLDTLSDIYYASSYSGKMGSDEYDKALQDWLNENTGGLLKDQADNISLNGETIMALAATIYFNARWHVDFSESETISSIFYSAQGEETCDFMNQSETNLYYWSENFSAVSKPMEGGGYMWFILPDEGVAVNDVLQSQETLDFLHEGTLWKNSEYIIVNLSVPKFDISSDIELTSCLKTLGITDIFDFEASDFSPMTSDTDDIVLSKAQHAVRVAIDEKGCTAAAYTVMMMAGAGAPPEDEVDFVLNRPFIFAITSESGMPLFTGVVNTVA